MNVTLCDECYLTLYDECHIMWQLWLFMMTISLCGNDVMCDEYYKAWCFLDLLYYDWDNQLWGWVKVKAPRAFFVLLGSSVACTIEVYDCKFTIVDYDSVWSVTYDHNLRSQLRLKFTIVILVRRYGHKLRL